MKVLDPLALQEAAVLIRCGEGREGRGGVSGSALTFNAEMRGHACSLQRFGAFPYKAEVPRRDPLEACRAHRHFQNKATLKSAESQQSNIR